MKKIALVLVLVTWLLAACTPSNTVTNNGGNQTVIVIEGDNSGNIEVQQGIVEDSSTTSNTAPAAATEATAPEATEEPAAEEAEVCFYTAWHDGWQDGPERIHTTGTLSRAALEKGISMQASWEKWTNLTEVNGFTIPDGFESNNDAVHGIVCGDTAYMLERTSESEMPFWFSSFFQLTPQGLLACKDDTGKPGSWIGKCDKNAAYVVIAGIPLDDVFVSDFQDNWDSLLRVRKSWDGPTTEYGTIEEAWTSTK